MSKMQCHISDGYQDPDDVPGDREVDEDNAYETYRQQCLDANECATVGCFNEPMPDSHLCEECRPVDEDSTRPMLHTKIGQYTGTLLYSYDNAYWWSEVDTAWRCYLKLRNKL